MLERHLDRHKVCVAITGAMKPSDQLGADGAANLRDAVLVRSLASMGILHLLPECVCVSAPASPRRRQHPPR